MACFNESQSAEGILDTFMTRVDECNCTVLFTFISLFIVHLIVTLEDHYVIIQECANIKNRPSENVYLSVNYPSLYYDHGIIGKLCILIRKSQILSL